MPTKGDARDIMNCAICTEPFRNPKCLPCIHTYCLECLEKYVKCRRPEEKLDCPLCRKPFEIPVGGLKNLPNNIFIDQILENSKLFKDGSTSNGVKCEGCHRTDAKKYCVECAQSMCDVCTVPHGKMKATQSHKVLSLKEREGSQIYMRARPVYCGFHAGEQLRLYCNDCSKAICVVCASADHRPHRCVDIETSSKKFREQLKKSYPKLDQNIKANESELKVFDKNKLSLMKQIQASEKAIRERGAELKRLVDSHCETLLDQLEKVKTDSLKKLKTRKEDVDGQLAMMKSFKTYVEELEAKGSACVVSQCAKDVLSRATDLEMSQVLFNRRAQADNSRPDQILFEPAEIPDIITGPMGNLLIGSIIVNDKIVQSSESVLVAVGLNADPKRLQRVCHVDLTRPDSVKTLDETPTWVDWGAAACVLDDTLYAVGIGRALNELWRWNPIFDWKRGADLAAPRRRHCVAGAEAALYALGGCSDAAGNAPVALRSIVSYNKQNNKWSAAGELCHAVYTAPCVAYKSSIYLFGGIDKDEKNVTHVQLYDPTQRKCSLVSTALPRAEFAMRAVLWETSAILLGPFKCFIYNLESNAWQERNQFATDVACFGLALVGQTLYIAGGASDMDVKGGGVTCTDEVRRVSVRDVIEGRRDVIEGRRDVTGSGHAVWKHHAKLPQPAMLHVYGLMKHDN